MKRALGLLLLVLVCGIALFVEDHNASSRERFTDDGSSLIGNWTGESICVGNNPACHDEQVVYRISKAPNRPGQRVITMDKIVDGKPETMAVLDFKYDSQHSTLVGEFRNARYHGVWEFTIKGNTMEGTLTLLPAKTIGRRVKVKKEG